MSSAPQHGHDSSSSRRAGIAVLAGDESLVGSDDATTLMLESLSYPAMVLNAQRQAVACNRLLLETLGITPRQAAGRRPGELLRCINASRGDDGCGSSEPCLGCGAVAAILGCQRDGLATSGRCRLSVTTLGHRRAIDLEVAASPLEVGGRRFTLFTLRHACSGAAH